MNLKKAIKPYCFCLFISILFLGICSKNSPLYLINDWFDANAFFTVGKSMMKGIVPYKSLFEQKGPLLYFIYGIGSLISYDSFVGVFIFEVIFFSVFLFYVYKTSKIFVKETNVYFFIILAAMLITSLKSFSHGGSAEEFCLPFMMYGIYTFIKFLKEYKITNKQMIISGICAGCIFVTKYTLLGIYIGIMLSFIVIMLLDKNIKDLIKKCIYFGFGFLIAIFPWIIYFCATNAIKEFIDVYFLINIGAYPKKISILSKIVKAFNLVIYNLTSEITYFIFIVIGSLLLFLDKNKWGIKYSNLSVFTVLILTGLCIFIGGTNYHYYPLALSPFIIIGMIKIFKNVNINKAMVMFFIPISLVSTFYLSSNTNMIGKQKEDYAQFKFGDIISKYENPKIINYGFLDGGFYLTSKTIPDCYYFMKNNISYENYPEMLDGQLEYIEKVSPEFVIIKNKPFGRIKKILSQKYEKISTHSQKYQKKDVTYTLYRIKK